MVINSQLFVSTPQALSLLSNSGFVRINLLAFHRTLYLNYGINQRRRRRSSHLFTILLYLCLYRAGGMVLKGFSPISQTCGQTSENVFKLT